MTLDEREYKKELNVVQSINMQIKMFYCSINNKNNNVI